MSNSVDWNNTITGSRQNAIDLNMNELRAGLGIPEPPPVPPLLNGPVVTNADTTTK